MQASEFVELVDKLAGQSAIDDVLSLLSKPPGRKPPEHLLRLSKWFNELDEADKSAVSEIIAETADATLFGVYCLLDGSRKLVEDSAAESVDLVYRGEDGEVLLASTDSGSEDLLHELRNSLI